MSIDLSPQYVPGVDGGNAHLLIVTLYREAV